jgi:hypothetical protein
VCLLVMCWVLFLQPGQSPLNSPPEATPSAALVSETPQASTHPVKRADEDRLTVFARTVLAPVLMKLPVRIFVLVGFCLMFALFTWNSTENTVVGLPPQDITLKGSYQVGFRLVMVIVPVCMPGAYARTTSWSSTTGTSPRKAVFSCPAAVTCHLRNRGCWTHRTPSRKRSTS